MNKKLSIIIGIALFGGIQLGWAQCPQSCDSVNTALGTSAFANNSTGFNDTALGSQALFSNSGGYDNTASGALALFNNSTGNGNTAHGYGALYSNTTGENNTATGLDALSKSTTSDDNTASGAFALTNNTTGTSNTAVGANVLFDSTTANSNTAVGSEALALDTTGSNNTALGANALTDNSTGGGNIAIGESAGINLTTGSNNIDIGNKGIPGEGNTIRIGKKGTQTTTVIAGIRGTTVAGGIGVFIDANGRLGTTTSSARFKQSIQPMDKASEAILALKPVTFCYKHELDPDGIPQFGLVAEQVEKVDPDLVARDDQGKPYTVRYEAVNAMLLNEFLKEHRKVEEQTRRQQELEATVAQQQSTNAEQQKEIENLTAALKAQAAHIQKVSDQLAAERPAPRIVANNQ